MDLGGDERLFYLIKIIRLYTGIQIFDVPTMMEKLKYFNKRKIDAIIKNDKLLANDITVDNNNVTAMLIINFLIKIFKLILIIINISYFLGFFWYILCDLSSRLYDLDNHLFEEVPNDDIDFSIWDSNPYYFIGFYRLYDEHINYERTDLMNGITVTYYAFTSLSTVGFGDYAPRSDSERLFCSFILLFGVAIFSYMMGIFIEILSTYQLLNADLDDGDNLARFFGLLKYFNENK